MALRTLALACVFSAVAADVTPWRKLDQGYTFENYEQEFARSYSQQSERNERKSIFERNLQEIIAHNSDPSNTWRRGLSDFTDRTQEEIRTLIPRGFDKQISLTEKRRSSKASPSLRTSTAGLPDRVDWREHTPPIITPVKNQGQCGSCWAFASTETLESHAAKASGRLEELSEQFILDCTPNLDSCGGTGGCMGGTAKLAYDKLKELGGMPSEWTYPYTSGNFGAAEYCHGTPLVPAAPHFGRVSKAVNVTGMTAVTSNDYAAVMTAIATVGPMTITVDAGGWHDYAEGVFTGGNHTNPDLDHLVQLVGYGTDPKLGDYWLVRNSWTSLWGEDGYIKLARYGAKGDEPCGVDLTPMNGDGCTGGPATVKVCGTSGMLYDAAYPHVA